MFSLAILVWLYIPVFIIILMIGFSYNPNKKAAVMLIIKDGLILSISRRDDHTKFGLIGGSVEPGESEICAAIRETKEECGLAVKSANLIFEAAEKKNKKGRFYTYCYYAEEWSGEPISSEEGLVCWLTVEELTNTKASFAEYNKQAIKSFKLQYPEVYLKGE